MVARAVTILLLISIIQLIGAFAPSRALISPCNPIICRSSAGYPFSSLLSSSQRLSSLRMSDSAAQPESQSILQKVRS